VPAAPPPAPPQQAAPPQPQQPAQPDPDAWKQAAPMCDCGTGQRTAVTWNKDGRTNYTFFCPKGKDIPKNQKCTPIDASTGKYWGQK
jgi:hypothetical protein